MQKKLKNLTKFFIFCAFFVGAIFCFIVWLTDPFEIWHKHYVCKDEFYSDMRYNAKRLIDGGDFDSVILGTSMLANNSAKQASDLLGGSFINISVWGSSLDERLLLLKYALRKTALKKVILSLDYIPLVPPEQQKVISKFDFLYNDSHLDDIKIYSNITHITKVFSLRCAAPIIADMPSAWINETKHMRRFGGLQNWDNEIRDEIKYTITLNLSNKNQPQLQSLVNKQKEYLEKNILSLAREFRQTEFIFILPPYFIAQNALYLQAAPAEFFSKKEYLKYILNSQLENIKIYAFDDIDFTTDIANYKDLVHYSPQINALLIELISKNQNSLNLNNLENYWNDFEKKVRSFDLFSFYEKL